MVSWVPGLRWVCYVRAVCSGPETTFHAVGVGHRRPRTVQLSARRAARLVGVVPFVEVATSDEPPDPPRPPVESRRQHRAVLSR
jgi:hypothetical protein